MNNLFELTLYGVFGLFLFTISFILMVIYIINGESIGFVIFSNLLNGFIITRLSIIGAPNFIMLKK